MANPSLAHQTTVKCILRYLAGTKDLRITYRKPQQSQSHLELLHGFADAAYVNNSDYCSTSGYVFIVGGGAITWGSRKQTSVALSSTEAEYVALSEATQESKWLQMLYEELGFEQNYPIPLFGDNQGSFMMVNNPQFHKRSKHIEIRQHWVREQIKKKSIELQDCWDPENTADVLMKQLMPEKHRKHTKGLGLIWLKGSVSN